MDTLLLEGMLVNPITLIQIIILGILGMVGCSLFVDALYRIVLQPTKYRYYISIFGVLLCIASGLLVYTTRKMIDTIFNVYTNPEVDFYLICIFLIGFFIILPINLLIYYTQYERKLQTITIRK